MDKVTESVEKLLKSLEELETRHEDSLCIASEQTGGKINKDIERAYKEQRERFRLSIYSLAMQSGLTHEEITEIHTRIRESLRAFSE